MTMKYIQKQTPPLEFIKYQRKKGSSFSDLSEKIKESLRKSLLEEQGYICCYCGQRVEFENSVIEHIKCRQRYPCLQLDYTNLVCSCRGGQDKRVHNRQYPLNCDANKGNMDIHVSPLDEECFKRLDFDDAGNIYGLDKEAKDTIEVLNLNNCKLKNIRNSAIEAYRWCDDQTDWRDELARIKEPYSDGQYEPFCFVIQKFIENYRL